MYKMFFFPDFSHIASRLEVTLRKSAEPRDLFLNPVKIVKFIKKRAPNMNGTAGLRVPAF